MDIEFNVPPEQQMQGRYGTVYHREGGEKEEGDEEKEEEGEEEEEEEEEGEEGRAMPFSLYVGMEKENRMGNFFAPMSGVVQPVHNCGNSSYFGGVGQSTGFDNTTTTHHHDVDDGFPRLFGTTATLHQQHRFGGERDKGKEKEKEKEKEREEFG